MEKYGELWDNFKVFCGWGVFKGFGVNDDCIFVEFFKDFYFEVGEFKNFFFFVKFFVYLFFYKFISFFFDENDIGFKVF